jgi:hypothetical protein
MARPPRPTPFFGLSPTQRSGVVSPKEQYEAWIYLGEFLRRAHGRIDPGVEKLASELWWHTLVTLADSLPPRLPPGVATLPPGRLLHRRRNRLDLVHPLEDMRDGRSEWGVIGQQSTAPAWPPPSPPWPTSTPAPA